MKRRAKVTWWTHREKTCPKCKETWPLTLAFWNLQYRNGVLKGWQSYCRACGMEHFAGYRKSQKGGKTDEPPTAQ